MEEPNDNIDTSIAELCDIKKRYVDKMWIWYRDNSSWPRIVFRLAGISIIVLSLSIPFIAATEGTWSKTGVSVAALLIAILSALNAFFAWQKMWEKRITIQLTLEGLMAVWETNIVAARRFENPEEGYKTALQATQDLIENTKALAVSETTDFFTNIKFPDVKYSKNDAP
mgnify:FL=1